MACGVRKAQQLEIYSLFLGVGLPLPEHGVVYGQDVGDGRVLGLSTLNPVQVPNALLGQQPALCLCQRHGLGDPLRVLARGFPLVHNLTLSLRVGRPVFLLVFFVRWSYLAGLLQTVQSQRRNVKPSFSQGFHFIGCQGSLTVRGGDPRNGWRVYGKTMIQRLLRRYSLTNAGVLNVDCGPRWGVRNRKGLRPRVLTRLLDNRGLWAVVE